jgi:negative regulator of flagellin synthesis FlgM
MEKTMSIHTIQSSKTAAVEPTVKKPATRPVEETKTAQKPANAAYKVSFSPMAEQLLKATPSEEQVRREKVDAIREQLASGSYNISGKDVAVKILNALKG